LSSRSLSKNIETKIYKNIISPVDLHEYGTWSLTLKEESKLRVFENKEVKKIFVPKWDETTGECRKIHIEELNDQYSSPHTIRGIKLRKMS
jgi:hypothetical protein